MKTRLVYIKRGTTIKGEPVNEGTVHDINEDAFHTLSSQGQAVEYDPVAHKEAKLAASAKNRLDAEAKAKADAEAAAKKEAEEAAKAEKKAKEEKKEKS